MSVVKNKIIASILISILNSLTCIACMHNDMQVYQDFEEDHKEAVAVAMPFFTSEQINEASTKLMRAVEDQDFNVAQEAIAEGADVSRNHIIPLPYGKCISMTPLRKAIWNKQADMIDLLLDHNAKITGLMVIDCAAAFPNFFVLNKLLSRNVNLNVIDKELYLGQSVTDELIGLLNRRDASRDSRYTKWIMAMQMFALSGADLTVKAGTSIFSRIVTGIFNPTYSKLPKSVRSYVCEIVTMQEECFKKLECIPKLLSHMPQDLVILIMDYAIPHYVVDVIDYMEEIDEDSRQVDITFNRTIVARWERIKNN